MVPGRGYGPRGVWSWGGCMVPYPPTPVNRSTERCKNITFPQLRRPAVMVITNGYELWKKLLMTLNFMLLLTFAHHYYSLKHIGHGYVPFAGLTRLKCCIWLWFVHQTTTELVSPEISNQIKQPIWSRQSWQQISQIKWRHDIFSYVTSGSVWCLKMVTISPKWPPNLLNFDSRDN